MPKNPRKRNRAKKLILNEFSAVDSPAQEGAIAAVIKSHEGKKVALEKRLADFATSSNEGHVHGGDLYIYEDGDYNIYLEYAVAEGSSTSHGHSLRLNEEGTALQVLENEGHTHDDIPLSDLGATVIQTLAAKLAQPQESTEKGETEESQMAKTTEKATDQEACRESDLSPEHKAYFDGLSEKDRGDFLRSDYEGREKAVAKAAEAEEAAKAADPVQKQIDELRAENAAMKAAAKDAEVTKRAESYGNLPKSLEVRKAIVSAFDAIEDEEVRNEAFELLDSANANVSKAFSPIGTSVDANGEAVKSKGAAESRLMEIARKDVAENGGDIHAALVKAAKANPRLAEATLPQNGA